MRMGKISLIPIRTFWEFDLENQEKGLHYFKGNLKDGFVFFLLNPDYGGFFENDGYEEEREINYHLFG